MQSHTGFFHVQCHTTKQRTFVLKSHDVKKCFTSLVRKSAPMVALYWFENFLLTYWFIKDVFPTPESPRIMTFSNTFFLEAIFSLRCKIKFVKTWKINKTTVIFDIFLFDRKNRTQKINLTHLIKVLIWQGEFLHCLNYDFDFDEIFWYFSLKLFGHKRIG